MLRACLQSANPQSSPSGLVFFTLPQRRLRRFDGNDSLVVAVAYKPIMRSQTSLPNFRDIPVTQQGS
jgi:hypothetical protein